MRFCGTPRDSRKSNTLCSRKNDSEPSVHKRLAQIPRHPIYTLHLSNSSDSRRHFCCRKVISCETFIKFLSRHSQSNTNHVHRTQHGQQKSLDLRPRPNGHRKRSYLPRKIPQTPGVQLHQLRRRGLRRKRPHNPDQLLPQETNALYARKSDPPLRGHGVRRRHPALYDNQAIFHKISPRATASASARPGLRTHQPEGSRHCEAFLPFCDLERRWEGSAKRSISATPADSRGRCAGARSAEAKARSRCMRSRRGCLCSRGAVC